MVPILADCFQVITFDNRGTGQSEKAPGPYTVPMLAADTLALLDHLQVPKANVLGHSLGGFIAQELAVTAPTRVQKLILASTGFGGPQMVPIPASTIAVMMNRLGSTRDIVNRGIEVSTAKGFSERQPEMVEMLVQYRMGNPVPPLQYAAQFAAGAGMGMLTIDQVNRRMAALSMPTLILSGDQDWVVPAGNADLMAAKIVDSKVQIIADTGHMIPIEAPEATARAVIDFIAS
jgi:pimeloyl-ACP methyl ester carboxylesterase